MRERKYDISGCTAPRAARRWSGSPKLPGVARSEVNLTTGIMTIAYDESQCNPEEQIVAKVEKAGFGAACTWSTRPPPRSRMLRMQDRRPEAAEDRADRGGGVLRGAAVCVHGADVALRAPALPLPDPLLHAHPSHEFRGLCS